MRAVVTGLASQPQAACSMSRSRFFRLTSASLAPRCCSAVFRSGRDQLAAFFDQHRQRGLRIRRDGQIYFVVAPEILIIALAEKIAGENRDDLRARFGDPLGLHAHPVDRRLGVRGDPHVGHFQAQDHVGGSHASGAIERMRGGEIHAEVAIHDRRLQRLGQFDQQIDAFRSARDAARDDHRILGVHQHFRGLLHRAVIARGRRGQSELGNLQPPRRPPGIGSSCSTASATITTGSMGGVIAIL